MDKRVKQMKAKSQKNWQEIEFPIYQTFGGIITFQALKQRRNHKGKGEQILLCKNVKLLCKEK